MEQERPLYPEYFEESAKREPQSLPSHRVEIDGVEVDDAKADKMTEQFNSAITEILTSENIQREPLSQERFFLIKNALATYEYFLRWGFNLTANNRTSNFDSLWVLDRENYVRARKILSGGDPDGVPAFVVSVYPNTHMFIENYDDTEIGDALFIHYYLHEITHQLGFIRHSLESTESAWKSNDEGRQIGYKNGNGDYTLMNEAVTEMIKQTVLAFHRYTVNHQSAASDQIPELFESSGARVDADHVLQMRESYAPGYDKSVYFYDCLFKVMKHRLLQRDPSLAASSIHHEVMRGYFTGEVEGVFQLVELLLGAEALAVIRNLETPEFDQWPELFSRMGIEEQEYNEQYLKIKSGEPFAYLDEGLSVTHPGIME